MTNDQILTLVLNRTRAFYERVYKPFNLATDVQLKRIETQLKKSFASAKSPAILGFAFLRDFEKAETNIVQYRKTPDKLKYEIENILTSWLSEKALKEMEAQNQSGQ